MADKNNHAKLVERARNNLFEERQKKDVILFLSIIIKFME